MIFINVLGIVLLILKFKKIPQAFVIKFWEGNRASVLHCSMVLFVPNLPKPTVKVDIFFLSFFKPLALLNFSTFRFVAIHIKIRYIHNLEINI